MDGRRIVVIGYDGAELLDIACVTSSLDTANRIGAVPAYQVQLATPGGRTIRCDSGLELHGQHSLSRLNGSIDTLLVSGGLGHEITAANEHVVGHVRRLARQSRRIASVCTGATVLAAAGLLDNRRATTHWRYATLLADSYPTVNVDPVPVFVRDGNISTSGGVTAALDLTLNFIEEDHGAELARRVALGMVTYLQRPGSQAQMSMFVSTPWATHNVIRGVIDHIAAHLAEDLTTANLAAATGVSERHLSRLLLKQAGQTPGRLVRQMRLEAAAHQLTSTRESLSTIASRCGFASAETLRQAFVARFGISPSRFRATRS